MRAITLSLPTLGSRSFYLRALDGHGELQVEASDPQSANRLLAALLLERDGSPVDLAGLLVTWRDRALAEIYRAAIGDAVECRSRCTECEEPFEFTINLSAVLTQQNETAQATGLLPNDKGDWELESGTKLRPPTLSDIAGADKATVLAKNLVTKGSLSPQEVDETLEDAAPLLGFEIETECPECGASQKSSFEIGRFLIESLAAERPFLIRETHLIASRYGWDHASIMALPRRDRQAYAGLIESERSASLMRRA